MPKTFPAGTAPLMPTEPQTNRDPLAQDRFESRHIGPDEAEQAEMLRVLGYPSLDALTDAAVPANIRIAKPLAIGAAKSERDALKEIAAYAAQNQVWRSYLGTGYSDCV